MSEGENYERPSKALVTFSEVTEAADSKLIYEGRWTDPSNNHTYPGTLRLSLPLDDNIDSFIATHDFESKFLILTLYLEDRQRAILRMGSDDDKEYAWDALVATELAVKIEYISVDLELRPEVEPRSAEIPKPMPWQAEFLASLANAQQRQLSATQDILGQIRAIRTILLALGIGVLLYFAARAN